MTRGTSKAAIQKNLYDGNITYYEGVDLDNSIQDAYDDVAVNCKNIVKKTTLSWVANLTYYDFKTIGVTDYLGCVAIFNTITNRFLNDDLGLTSFDKIRIDWEKALGTPIWWTPVNFKYIAVFKKYGTAAGTFDLYYWAVAPTLTSDSDSFLIAEDMADIIEYYVTADLFEQAQEFTKAQKFWGLYFDHLKAYKERVKNLAKRDLFSMV